RPYQSYFAGRGINRACRPLMFEPSKAASKGRIIAKSSCQTSAQAFVLPAIINGPLNRGRPHHGRETMTKPTKDKRTSRRRFLKVAAAGAAATVAAPAAIAQTGPINMRWQSTWPSKDIFHEYALDYAKKVNDMTGGDLKIEVLPAGAVVPAFGLL